jgi:hypothetical protein
MKDPVGEAKVGASVGWLRLWLNLMRYAVPVVLLWVLWNSVPSTFEAVVELFLG